MAMEAIEMLWCGCLDEHGFFDDWRTKIPRLGFQLGESLVVFVSKALDSFKKKATNIVEQ